MKILLSLIFDRNEPIKAFFDHFYSWLIANIPSADVKILICEKYYNENKTNHLLDKLNPVLMSKTDMQDVFGLESIDCFSDEYARIYNNGLSENEFDKFKKIINSKLDGWVPDIVITQGFESSYTIWHGVFQNALVLNQENAIFSRPPFNRTLSYDPYTAIPDNFLVRFSEQIKSFKISDDENKLVNKFKKSLTDIIDKYSPLDDIMTSYYKLKFDKLVLLPLIGDKYIKLFNDCFYENEFDLVEDVLQKTPKNIGVFVTQHDSGGSLTPENIKYFTSKYPNFVFLQQTNIRGYANNSLNYFKYVDAVLNITSKAGFMALIYDKPVISLAKKYNKWYADGNGIESLESVLNTPYKNKNNALYWYFTRYVVFQEDFGRKDFLYNFLNGLLEQYRTNGIDFNFYQQINDFNKIFDYVIRYVVFFYQRKSELVPKQIIDLQNKLGVVLKWSFKYKIVRFLSHITFGKTRKYFNNIKKSMLI